MKKILSVAALLVLVLAVSAQNYTVDTSKSNMKWTGKKVTGEHYGNIDLKEGAFEIKNGKVSNGKFVIDMTSLTVTDLEGEWMEKLLGHLKSDDFFGVENHPEAVLEVTGSSKLKNDKATVKGNLSIKGKTHPVEFEATQDGKIFTALVTVDRTLYDIRYGSGKFFDNLGDKTIDDEFTLEVSLQAK